jgi:hypothetical protein
MLEAQAEAGMKSDRYEVKHSMPSTSENELTPSFNDVDGRPWIISHVFEGEEEDGSF